MDSKRITLTKGNWAEVRSNITVGDLRYQRQVAHDRGFEDQLLDGIALLKRVVISWSFGDVTDEAIDELSMDDATTLITGVTVTSGETPSTSSSDGGTGRRAKKSR